jgi:hypothetical protein
MPNLIFNTGEKQPTEAITPDKIVCKKAFEHFIKEDIIGNWFAGTDKMQWDYGKTRKINNIRVARFKLELDYTRDKGYLHLAVVDYEYEDIELEDAFFQPFEAEVHHTTRGEIVIPYPHTDSGWLDAPLVKRAFMRSFEEHWPIGKALVQVILRMPAKEVVDKIRTTDLGGAPKNMRFGGWSLRVDPFRKETGIMYGTVRLLTSPVKDFAGNDPGFHQVVEWNALDWDAKRDLDDPRGNMNEKIVRGLRRKLRTSS